MTGSVRSGGVTNVSNEDEVVSNRLLRLVTVGVVSIGYVVGVIRRAFNGSPEGIGQDDRVLVAAGEALR